MTDKGEQMQRYIEALEDELEESSQGLVAITMELEKAQEKYRDIVERSIKGIYQADLNGHIQFANSAFAQLIGFDAVETLLQELPDVGQIYVDQVRHAQIMAMLESGEPLRGVVSPVKRQDGETIVLEEHARLICDANGQPSGYEVIAEDISRQFQSEQRIMLLAKVFEYSIEGIMITDASNHIIEVNRAFSEITLYSAEEAIGQTPHMLFSGWHNADFYKKMWEGINNRGIWQGEVTDRRKNGETFVQWVTICSVRDATGSATNYIGIFNDITSKKESEKKIHQLAYYDHLTTLPNRSLFYDRVAQAIRMAIREGGKLGILFIDLDNFKHINDTHGHLIGDRFLIKVADILRSCVREEDTVARLGGDEFVLLLEGLCDSQGASAVAKNILSHLVGAMNVDGHELSSGASIGISIFPDDGNKLDELIKRADSAMYNAKEGGKNDYRFFTADMNEKVIQRLRIETDLRRAIDGDQFCLHYQPKKRMGSAVVAGVEGLLRWQHPELGLLEPAYFLSVAEESGLINQIGQIVFATGMRQAMIWQQQGMEVTVALNLSARQLRQRHFVEDVEALLIETGCDASLLELELTESAILDNPDMAIAILSKLRKRGFKISLDDFGTGYSSLSYLKQLPIDKVKIDRSFVSELPEDQESVVLVEAIIALSHKMRLAVIAEGVENEQQLHFLEAQGCEEVQGYYYSRPLSAEKLEQFCQAQISYVVL